MSRSAEVFRVLLRLRVKPGLDAEFERVWREVGTEVAAHPANLGQWLARDLQQEGVFHIVSDWTDEASFRAFESSARHHANLARLDACRAEGAMTTARLLARPARAGEVRVLLHHVAEEPAGIERAYHQVSAAMAAVPGLLGNELLRGVPEGARFVVLSRWRDLESFQAWEDLAGHRDISSPLRRYRDHQNARPFEIYEVTGAWEGAEKRQPYTV